MNKDEQEALSRAHSDDVIRLLPLSSGAVAVFNNARELCSIMTETNNSICCGITIDEIKEVWFPPKKPPAIDLKELGLI